MRRATKSPKGSTGCRSGWKPTASKRPLCQWRAVFNVSDKLPGALAVQANAQVLAAYAAICQASAIVPIVEPEVLMDGDHDMARCASVTERVLHAVFHALHRYGVVLEHMVLKPSMVIAGKKCAQQASVQEVATETVRVLKRAVPAAVPGIFFLSGGQTPEQATANLDAMNRLGPLPWPLSFSYGRACRSRLWRHGMGRRPTWGRRSRPCCGAHC